MNNASPSCYGYTFGLAVRHLLIGPFRPRAAVREGLNARLGEGGRIALFAAAIALYGLTDPEARTAVETYVETVRKLATLYDWVLGAAVLGTMLGLFVIVLYVGQSVVLHAALRIGALSKPAFATTRSVLVLSDWITVGLGCAVLLTTRGLLPELSIGPLSIEFAILSAMIAPHLVLFISEATGSSLARSAALLLLALVGDIVISFGIDAGFEHLNAFLRSISPEYDPA